MIKIIVKVINFFEFFVYKWLNKKFFIMFVNLNINNISVVMLGENWLI